PSRGARVYMGADDNLDNGEHDSSSKIGDGPSDGGAIVFNVAPDSLGAWLNALVAGDAQYVLTHPVPLVDAGFGSCADGVCESVQTQQRTAYQGSGKPGTLRTVPGRATRRPTAARAASSIGRGRTAPCT